MKNKYNIKDNEVFIVLNSKKYGDKTTVISIDDFEKVNSFDGKWYLWHREGEGFYAKGNVKNENGKKTTIFLHRFLLGLTDKSEHVDHFDFDGLNNTRGNLRVTTNQGNSQNRNGSYSNSKTGIRGVSFVERLSKYQAYINVNYKKYNLGHFNDIDKADKVASVARAIMMPMSSDVQEEYAHYCEPYDYPCLFFRYGAMGAGKTEALITSNYVYQRLNKKTLVFSPMLDDRNGVGVIKSRNGESINSITFDKNTNIFDIVKNESPDYVIIDEIQFADKETILTLTDIVDELGVNVICYGLKNDFMNRMFEGSEYMFIYSDVNQEIYDFCDMCQENKAIMNPRFLGDNPVFEGSQIQIGDIDSKQDYHYKPVCRKCYKKLQRSVL